MIQCCCICLYKSTNLYVHSAIHSNCSCCPDMYIYYICIHIILSYSLSIHPSIRPSVQDVASLCCPVASISTGQVPDTSWSAEHDHVNIRGFPSYVYWCFIDCRRVFCYLAILMFIDVYWCLIFLHLPTSSQIFHWRSFSAVQWSGIELRALSRPVGRPLEYHRRGHKQIWLCPIMGISPALLVSRRMVQHQ